MNSFDDAFTVYIGEGPHSQTLMDIMNRILPNALALFAAKNKGYGDMADVLGSRAQFVDMHRKMDKLKRGLWEGQDIGDENVREVTQDLFGHCLLLLRTFDLEYRAATQKALDEEKARG